MLSVIHFILTVSGHFMRFNCGIIMAYIHGIQNQSEAVDGQKYGDDPCQGWNLLYNVHTSPVKSVWSWLSLYIRSDAHLEAVGDVEFGRRDAHQIVHQHHDHDGDEHGKVADGGAHLRKSTRQTVQKQGWLYSTQIPWLNSTFMGFLGAIEPMETK